jgi:hypothetical protein
MRVLLFGCLLATLTSCGTIPSELWTGVNAKDQAEVRAAASRLTASPIKRWELYPDATKPTEIRFDTKDGRRYRAQKIRGKWHVEDITDVVFVV